MFELIVIAIANLLVGGCIGLCGIAGFLLPITFAGYLGLPIEVSLTLSFFSFLISGFIGSFQYFKKGNLNVPFSIKIGIASFVGAILGVFLNSFMQPETAKLLLYAVVLLSGFSILLKKEKKTSDEDNDKKNLLDNTWIVIVIGIVTGAICSLSGAGGPILVMPILVSLGMDIRVAIGVSLFDSIFIAFPAFFGYIGKCDIASIWKFLLIGGICHAIGILIGSKNAHKIKQKPLKMGVALFSILIAVYMIATL